MPCLSLTCSSQTTTQAPPKPTADPDPDPFAPLLRDSTARFIADYRNAATDFSSFTSIFSRLIHSVSDPPLEVLWFYSAVIFQETKLATPRRARIPAVKDLFQLLVSCSASAGPVKRIAVLAPAVYELCELAFEKEQLEREDIRSLLEGLVSYINLCCMEIRDDDSEDGGDHRLSSQFPDVIRMWIVDKFCVGDDLKAFFPIVADGVCTGMLTEELCPCRVSYLAGVVMCEAFLLRLFLRIGGLEVSRAELEKDLQNCTNQMIASGLRCFSFFETLLKTMLEPVLPVANLLKSKDECLLRGVLYNSVITADDSFFKSRLVLLLPSERLKNLAVIWLLVTDDAIRFTRKYGDQSKVITYISVFSESFFASHLIQWITNQIGMERKTVPNVSTPAMLIKWMRSLEDQGVRVFDCEISRIRAKGATCGSRFDHVLPVAQTLDVGDLEMVDLEDTPRIDGQRKRKVTMAETEIQAKIGKYQAYENSVGSSCGSEMGNLVSDREMVDMQQ